MGTFMDVAAPAATPPAPCALRAEPVGQHELLAEELELHLEVLKPLGLRRQQHLVVASLDDRVAQTRVLVGDAGARFDVFQVQHGWDLSKGAKNRQMLGMLAAEARNAANTAG